MSMLPHNGSKRLNSERGKGHNLDSRIIGHEASQLGWKQLTEIVIADIDQKNVHGRILRS